MLSLKSLMFKSSCEQLAALRVAEASSHNVYLISYLLKLWNVIKTLTTIMIIMIRGKGDVIAEFYD